MEDGKSLTIPFWAFRMGERRNIDILRSVYLRDV